jgi:hypothetical protein
MFIKVIGIKTIDGSVSPIEKVEIVQLTILQIAQLTVVFDRCGIAYEAGEE